jgi:hypothetical protein
MQKTFLILITDFEKIGVRHMALGTALKKDGHKVIYALASYLAIIYMKKIDLSTETVYIFSEYFKKHYHENRIIPSKYKNININKMFFSEYDRLVHLEYKPLTNEYYTKLMTNLILFFDEIYDKHRYDFCLYEAVSNSFAYPAFYVTQLSNAIYCGYVGSRLGGNLKGRFELWTEEYGAITEFSEKFTGIDLQLVNPEELNEINNYLKLYQTNENIPSYHNRKTTYDWKNQSLIKVYFNKKRLDMIFAKVAFIFSSHNTAKYSHLNRNLLRNGLLGLTKYIKRVIKFNSAKKYFDKINYEDDFVLYPLQFKPEASTSVLARSYCNDLAVIENIAFNLPFNIKLYVKEHFVNYGRPPIKFYKDLKKIPNVKLIFCDENTKVLIQKSIAVIVLTSTVGFEALLMNKPTILLGNVFYQCHPNCYKVNSYEEIFELINNGLVVDSDPEINQRFILAYKNITYEGDTSYYFDEKDEFPDKFKIALYKKYNISPYTKTTEME